MIPCSNQHPAVQPSIINLRPDKPLFPIGKVVATPGAVELLKQHELSPFDFIVRHWQGDWGDLGPEDVKANQYALRHRTRILSSYRIEDAKLWIITEADRSATTLLLPSEY